jgi:hypothetical protein
MTVDEIVAEVIALLQKEERVSYRLLKRRFDLDDDYIADLKVELIKAKRLAVDEDGEVLVWTGGEGNGESAKEKLSVPRSVCPQCGEPLFEEAAVEGIQMVLQTLDEQVQKLHQAA